MPSEATQTTNSTKTETRGGRRVAGPGKKIGRPFGKPKVKYGTMLTPDVAEFLRSLPVQSDGLDRLVRRSKEFRKFMADR